MSAEWGKNETQYKDDFHELAHGWWGIANVTTDDWINEGGAEFSAYAAAKHIYGEEYSRKCISDYIEAISKSTEKVSIVDTTASSPDRYVNHYQKTAIMFINAQKEFGNEKVFSLLKRVYQTFKGTKAATTERFLSICDADMRNFYEDYLFATGWENFE
jgi:hypothetical protein